MPYVHEFLQGIKDCRVVPCQRLDLLLLLLPLRLRALFHAIAGGRQIYQLEEEECGHLEKGQAFSQEGNRAAGNL